ncbi:MAG: hypothetical protein PQJ58_14920 [Spirochaetales bacterium]|nr:hypothetical protein [Spirochaetales bacterium]
MVLKQILLAVIPFLMLSCSVLEPGVSVLQGNYAYQQGNYQNALLHYLKQEDREDPKDNHRERVLYNIATVYYALGEGTSALGLWQRSELTTDEEVLFASRFNSGVVLYQSGQFAPAYNAFRSALELKPASLEAKKNLELTLERLEAEARTPEGRTSPAAPEISDDARRIMQYIRRKEAGRWKQQENVSDSDQDW